MESLFSHLGRSIQPLERDTEQRAALLAPRESQALLANFGELRRLIESSRFFVRAGQVQQRGRNVVHGSEGGSSGTRGAGLVATLSSLNKGIKGMFQSRSSRNTSVDDLANSSVATLVSLGK